jgi:hypothetical protein
VIIGSVVRVEISYTASRNVKKKLKKK